MAIRLHFWGADQTVTGSSHHIECAGQNVLLDCGLYQGHRQQAADINSHLAFTPQQLAAGGLNAVVLSHAHIDHSGDLPLLAKQGYRGPIYTCLLYTSFRAGQRLICAARLKPCKAPFRDWRSDCCSPLCWSTRSSL